MEGKELQNQKILYLFSSNQLPQYERDAIDAVCLPSGSIMQFRYGSINIDPSIKDLITQGKQATLIGQKVLVVFVNVKGREDNYVVWEPEFYPLRSGKLVQCRQADNTTLFFFELTDEFIDYESHSKADLDKLISNLSMKPLKGSSPGAYLPGIFAGMDKSLPSDIFTATSSARFTVITALMEEYPDRMFYSINVEKTGKDHGREKLSLMRFPNRIDPVNGYQLSSRRHYSLMFHYYFKSRKGAGFTEVTINIRDPKSIVGTDLGSFLLGNRSDEMEIKLYPKGTSSRSNDTRLEINAVSPVGKDLGKLSVPILVKRNFAFLIWLVAVGSGLIISSIFPNNYAHVGGSLLSTLGIFFLANTYK